MIIQRALLLSMVSLPSYAQQAAVEVGKHANPNIDALSMVLSLVMVLLLFYMVFLLLPSLLLLLLWLFLLLLLLFVNWFFCCCCACLC